MKSIMNNTKTIKLTIYENKMYAGDGQFDYLCQVCMYTHIVLKLGNDIKSNGDSQKQN